MYVPRNVPATADQLPAYLAQELREIQRAMFERDMAGGNATGWRDLFGNVHPKSTGAGTPTRQVYAGGTVGQYAFVLNDIIDFEFHCQHDYKPGTDVFFHIHWSHNGTAISGNVVFTVYHQYAKGHNQANFSAEKSTTITYNTTNVTTTPRYRHRIDEIQLSQAGGSATLQDTADIEVDGVFLITVKVTTLPTITAGNLFIHYGDFHYQTDRTNTLRKSPNPSFYA